MTGNERKRLQGIIRDANALLMSGPNPNRPDMTNVAVLENVLDDVLTVLNGGVPVRTSAMRTEDDATRTERSV